MKILKGVLLFSCIGAALGVHAQNEPYRVQTEFVSTPPLVNIGADSITSAAQWAFVTNQATCNVRVYQQLQGETMPGDGDDMDWVFKEIVLGSPLQCANTRFGVSSSIAGNVAVVGGPGFGDDRGSWFIFEYDPATDDWSRVGNRKSPNINVKGQLFGDSISISQVPGTKDYLIAVGAPGYDESSTTDPGSNEGRVELYSFSEGTNSPSHIANFIGAPGERLGFSVSANYPYVIVGGIGIDDFGGPSGGAVILDASGAEVTRLGTSGGLLLGANVSLSDRLALMSGAARAKNSFAWSNSNPDLSGTPIWDLSSNIFTANGNPDVQADVSQDDGVAAFSDVGSGTTTDGRVEIYRNAATDAEPGDAIEIVFNADFPGDLSDAGGDIRLNSDALWVANSTWDAGGDPDSDEGRVFVYQYPCGYGTLLEADVWSIVSIPCDLGSANTVDDVFGANLSSSFDVYEVYESDPATDFTSRDPYRPLSGSDTVNQNQAYWVKATAREYFTIREPASAPLPDWTDVNIDLSSLGSSADRGRLRVVNVQPDMPAGGSPGDEFARIMVANPFSRSFFWGEVLYVSDTIVGVDQAKVDGKMENVAYVYDPSVFPNPQGQAYRAITTTPGFDNEIRAYEGFWIKLLSNADPAHGLIIPRPR